MDDDKLRRDEHASVMRSRNLFLGVTLIVVGVLWMMNNLELLSDSLFDVVFSWQMLLVLIGGYLLALRKWLAGGIDVYKRQGRLCPAGRLPVAGRASDLPGGVSTGREVDENVCRARDRPCRVGL